MKEYDTINEEIKKFLTLSDRRREEKRQEETPKATQEDMHSLISLLTNLQNIYSDINAQLLVHDNEGLKNTVLNSDIKMSLVSESLIRVLKDVCQEKNELMEREAEYQERIKKLTEEREGAEIRLSKMESDNDFISRGNQELSRIIQDQKNKIQGFREKAELERRNCDSFRAINEELETLRKKALEKCDVYEKEIGVLKEYLRDRDESIKKVKESLRNEEKEREGLGKKMVGLEKTNELLRKKIEVKDNSLGLCNSELSKLISKEKRIEGELESLKEKASYYERLYRATNSQNEYLNSQLSRMITMENVEKLNVPEYVPEPTVEATKEESKESAKMHMRRARKYKHKVAELEELVEKQRMEMRSMSLAMERLKDDNSRLQEDRKEAVSSNNRILDNLMGKVEALLEKNREYQSIIYELRSGRPRERKETAETLLKLRPECDESFKTVDDGEEKGPLLDGLFRKKSVPGGRPDPRRYDREFFKLEADYEDKQELGIGRHEGFPASSSANIQSKMQRNGAEKDTGKMRLETNSIRLNLPENFYTSLVKKEKPRDRSIILRSPLGQNNEGLVEEPEGFDFVVSKDDAPPADPFKSSPNGGAGAPVAEDDSLDSLLSPKTVRTTSTLQNMLRRTDELQRKFDTLEEQLRQIKRSDKAEPEKIHDQLKAYANYYYSDYLDLSNESDFM
jgi:hypothetical protein